MRPDNSLGLAVNIYMGEITDGERHRLINQNAYIVPMVASVYRGAKGIPFEEMLAQGMLGLVAASHRAKVALNFQDYAAETIRNHIRDFIKSWQPMVTAPDPDSDAGREFWEWAIWSYAAPYEQWTTLAATPEEMHCEYSQLSATREAIRSAMIGFDPLSRGIMIARFFKEPRKALHVIARDYEISYSKTVRIIDRSLKSIKEILQNRAA